MARLVQRTATAPVKIEVGGEAKWICACGLSKNQPLCDGSHKRLGTVDEGDQLYWYDADGKRQECREPVANIRSW
jgi:CDGSH-type Zn-finger protein